VEAAAMAKRKRKRVPKNVSNWPIWNNPSLPS
jgi:hypothetical protein